MIEQTTECPVCHGMGYTAGTAAEMEMAWSTDMGAYVEVKTRMQGSGCPRCCGTGQLP